MPALLAPLEEARENLRVIRQTMERSTKYSTLSGLSGVLIGLTAIVSVLLTHSILNGRFQAHQTLASIYPKLGLLWLIELALAVCIEFACNKRRARHIGKRVASPLGAHILVAAVPSFVGSAALTVFFALHGMLPFVWGIWMLTYGLAICAVGLFSVRPVSYLGAAFVMAGAITLLLPVQYGLFMMGLTFGGFHIGYGVLMAKRHGW
ncbi:MAG: hypothetical protein ACRYFS_06590 [Janthinobacterium lividum]